MDIILYKSLSDRLQVGKLLTAPVTISATLKEDCSIESPVFRVSRGARGYFIGYNYMYIPEFKRYYYAHITIKQGGIAEITGDVDALQTFGGQIRNLNALVERQETFYDPYICDSGITIAQGSLIKAIEGQTVGEESTSIYLTAIGAVGESGNEVG